MTTLTDTPIMNTKNSEQSVVISIKRKNKKTESNNNGYACNFLNPILLFDDKTK